MDSCISLNGPLHIDGGMSQNPYFTQFLANVTGCEVRPALMPELTGLGTISLAATAIGAEVNLKPQFGQVQPEDGVSVPTERFHRALAVSKAP